MLRPIPFLYFWLLATSFIDVSHAASFDCAKAASRAEILICSDPALSMLDEELSVLHRRARAAASDPAGFTKESRSEWRRRESLCQDRDCLLGWYAHRREQLLKGIARSQPLPAAAIERSSPPSAMAEFPPPAPASADVLSPAALKAAMRDARKLRFMECMGVDPGADKPAGWKPPTYFECKGLDRILEEEARARGTAVD